MFKIATDSGSDLPKSFIEEHNIGLMNLTYILDGESYGHGKELDAIEFFAKMRAGATPSTSQVNPEEATEYFTEYLKESNEILYIGLTSGISGTYNSVKLAASEIMEENKDVKIICLDPRCASFGLGLMVYYAVKLRDEGKTIDEVADFVNNTIITHLFTVDNLMDLWRGGRVSRTTAIVGTLASIKPVLHVDDDGKLTPVTNVRGRKKSLDALVDLMAEKMGSKKDLNKEMYSIGHGDCEEDAIYVRDKMKEKYGFENILMSNLGPVIGSHTGPSIIVLCCIGEQR